ncbi:PREDICTED: pentatricopeptide repeat-containing protein At3g14730 [Nicotiana attenuata]|uniref:Pentatricopeptide repeat-containing protein n=1 Tax=Nicotiana attenuata TaxID=49451 RepID=A0A1J6I6P1_NICAT|nr:PREDICTED: pentatricopeptide repeat-containing protein At3g14730 [Nicotiana attenuata]XP_019249399.1 PREDICTED: pentatricopeptide repeat-containing protein At3g14730 [Nicotiana attenuata]XP_019249400.1 PREDICTED: pentatricopeptide repeat-containing protein At3g14730 [Nicotiana attenuata]XP_019249401.1 PREDICTED: pentatricopeptide repeat-containing protein At3g14730 [Nicotiana attenuata]OIT00124.1 pentatricopeptide repeat-containing protein [Nicotiana attenuata]
MSQRTFLLKSLSIFKAQCQYSNSFSSIAYKSFDLKTCIVSLQSCANDKNLAGGKQVHCHMLRFGHLNSSPLPTTSLINMYSKCNSLSDALSVFYASPLGHNVFAYNAIIAGLISNDLPKRAFEFYCQMRVVGVLPDKFTFPCVLKACCNVVDVKNIHGLVFKLGLEVDLFIGSSLLHSYLMYGMVDFALDVFEELPEREDVVLWNAMINGYAQTGEFGSALMVFRWMIEDGVIPNRFTITGVLSALANYGEVYNGKVIHGFVIKKGFDLGVAISNALIDMYGKCRCVTEALEVFEMMAEKDIFSWNSVICVHEQCGDHDGTLKLFRRMLSAAVRPDLVTVTTTLPACAHLAALRHGREIHAYMIVNGVRKDADYREYDDTYIDNAILDMYAKCGSMREAQLIFDMMHYKDVASWNIMIKGYGMHGFGIKALELFSNMCKAELRPDDVTFVGVLSACSHSGLIKQGKEFLAQMQPKYGVVPSIEHYTSVIDMLGRDGQLEAAYELLLTMPIKANSVVWRAFLAACRLHDNSDLAEVAAKQVLDLEPEHCGSYVILSNIYGQTGRYEEVLEVRDTMRLQNVRKTPGCSWIELNNGVHVFITADKSHPEGNLIYAGLNSLTARLREHGYTPDSDAFESSP